jgi:uncharacterized MAPEG superfamily protein
MSVEMQILFCAVALGIVQLVLSVLFSVSGRGLAWGIGPRDEARPALAKIGGRIERAWDNFRETFPLFAVAVLIGQALGLHTAMSVLGAQIYIWARLLYVPAYVIAIPGTRTLTWAASFAGILLVLSPIWPG